MKRAFITGITGQDGSYLCELLLKKDYEVHGLVHRPDALFTSPISPLISDPKIYQKSLFLHHGAFEDSTRLFQMIQKVRPHEFYHLAGQSSPRLSLEMPETTVESVGMASVRLLEMIRGLTDPPQFLHASSSEVFGTPSYSPQNELTPMNAATPYGAAKILATQMVRIYRQAHCLPMCNAILYNHESPRRSQQFVTMKIAQSAARIKKGLQKELVLGSLAGRRDWGWAPDYVEGMWRMLQMNPADDFVLATGKLHSVKELVVAAFEHVGLHWEDYVKYDANLVLTIEPISLCGNPTKAKRLLGWECHLSIEEMMCRLVEAEQAKLD